MKEIIVIILTTLGLNCTAQDTIFFNKNWKKTLKDSAEFFRVDLPDGNNWKRSDYYFKNKQIQMTGTYSLLNPEKQEGYFIWYYPNGKIKHTGNFENGKEIGEHLWYTENGILEAKENYFNGLLNGPYAEYFPNSKLLDKTEFVDGKQNGWTEYYREDGSKQSEGFFKNGNRNGEWKYYDQTNKIIGTTVFKTEFMIPEAKMYIQLPNDEWRLTDSSKNEIAKYIFKRHEVIDTQGRTIIPGIVLTVEDAKKYDQDVTKYFIDKVMAFQKLNLGDKKILSWQDPNYPIPYKNSMIMITNYSSGGFDHIIFMVYIITSENKGIQIYLDMTKDVASKYEPEFWTTLRSIKEL